MPAIRIIGRQAPVRQLHVPAPEKIVAGDPRQWFENYYEDPSGQFLAGLWEGQPGTVHVAYTEHELCVILSGSIKLTGDDGSVTILAPGDSFIVPAGFTGTWENIGTVRKIYAIFQPPG